MELVFDVFDGVHHSRADSFVFSGHRQLAHKLLHRLDLSEKIACSFSHSFCEMVVGGIIVVHSDECFELWTKFMSHRHRLLL